MTAAAVRDFTHDTPLPALAFSRLFRLKEFARLTTEAETRPGDKTGAPIVPERLVNSPLVMAVLGGALTWFVVTNLGQINKTPSDLSTLQTNYGNLSDGFKNLNLQVQNLQQQVNLNAVETGKVQVLMSELSRRSDAVATELRNVRNVLQDRAGQGQRGNFDAGPNDEEDMFRPKPQSLKRAEVE